MMDGLSRHDPAQAAGYRMLARLGEGGMGRVFLARSPAGIAVAFKLIRPDVAGDGQFRARFAREVAAARSLLGKRGIAAVLDADPTGPEPWLATEYVPGISLQDAVADLGPLPLETVRTLARGLAEALTDMHAGGLTHRDLKPSNLMLAADGPRVIDFGIARAADASRLTRTGLLVGSPGFISPEQVVGEEIGPATDLFGFGSVLVYALTGEGPYGDGPPEALLYRVVNAAPNLAGVPESLRPMIERCLRRDPAERPAAPELAAEFARPGSAEPPARGGWLPAAVRLAVLERTEQAAALLAAPAPETEAETPLGAPVSFSASPFESAAVEGTAAAGGRPGRRRALLFVLAPVVVVGVTVAVMVNVWGGNGQASANLGGSSPSVLNGAIESLPAASSSTPSVSATSPSATAARSSTPATPATSVARVVVRPATSSPAESAPASVGVECSLEGPFTTSCSSTNPKLAIYQWNVNDTSACTFTYHLDWGDGTGSTVVVPGGSASSLYVDEHTYRTPGSYSPALTATKVTGNCTAFNFDYSYTYQ